MKISDYQRVADLVRDRGHLLTELHMASPHDTTLVVNGVPQDATMREAVLPAFERELSQRIQRIETELTSLGVEFDTGRKGGI